jgi:hypothetical protein
VTAELLREAAALMRSRAEAAAPGPWYANPGGYVETDPFMEGEGFNMVADAGGVGQVGHAAYIASWHPAVALAVADWLDETARRHDDILDTFAPGSKAEHRIDRAMAVVLLTMETEETAAELTRLERFAAQADGVTS